MWRFSDMHPDLAVELRERYSEPHRAYHTWDHVETLLGHFERFEWNHPKAVEIAIYYHDAIYVPLSPRNEADSAGLILSDLLGELDSRVLVRAMTMVLATATHQLPEDVDRGFVDDCARLLDMDLAILGSEPRDFAAYDAAIRQEFSALPDDVFLERRRQVMSAFLERRPIFRTWDFYRAHEAQARANLRRLIARLSAAA